MKKKLTLLAFWVLVCLLSSAQNIRGNTYQLTCELVSEPPSVPHCGVIAWAVVAEMKVIQFSDPDYTAATIPVIITCPEFDGKEFWKMGVRYKLKLSDKNQADFGWSIPNEEVLEKYQLGTRYYIVVAKKE